MQTLQKQSGRGRGPVQRFDLMTDEGIIKVLWATSRNRHDARAEGHDSLKRNAGAETERERKAAIRGVKKNGQGSSGI